MIRENAIVIGRNGNQVEIEVQRQSSCGHCSLSKGCGVGAIGRLMVKRQKPVIIDSELNLKRGDRILLGISEQGYLKASLLVYGMPLMFLVIASIVAQILSNGSELVVLIAAVCGFLGGISLCSRMIRKRYASQLNPRILQVNNEPIN